MDGKSLKSNLIWNSVGSFVYLFCQWMLTWLVIRLSDNLEDAGNLSLAVSITNIFYNLACFNVRPFLVSDNTNEYEVEDYTTFRVATMSGSVLLCLIYTALFRYSLQQFGCIMLYMIFKLGEALVDLFHSFEQRKGRMDIGGISLLCRGILSVLSFMAGMKFFGRLEYSILFMIISTALFIAFFDYRMVIRYEKIKVRIVPGRIKEMLLRFFPIAVGIFAGLICASFPRQLLEKLEGTDILGIYTAIATPAVLVQVAESYIFNPFLVSLADLRKNGDRKGFMRLFLSILAAISLISLVCYLGSIILARPVLAVLYKEEVSKYAFIFPGMIIYTALNGVSWFFYNILIILRNIYSILVINVIALVVCLAVSDIMITKYSMQGVNYTMTIYTLFLVLVMITVIYRSIGRMETEEKQRQRI